jgi:hypothetical protein
MDTLTAFAMGKAARGNPVKVFDWDEAATRIKAAGVQNASAGLSGDWEWTGGQIFADGKPVPAEDTYTYLASTWATPELAIGDGLPEACWKFKADTDGWDAGTYWPDSALAILRGE